jgi:amino acid permease
MVGGGSLSLPMAFQKSGTLMLGPLIMIAVAMITEFCFRIHVYSARIRKPVGAHDTAKGTDSFESIAAAAFGPKMYVFGAFLVTSMCFFGTVGYAVLLRDMLQPVTDLMWKTPEAAGGPTLHNNLTMLVVVVLVTPLCTLRNLTALERFGAFSMLSVLILGSCVVLRSVQCNLGYLAPNTQDLFLADNKPPTFQLWPDSWKDLLDAFPLYVSCFVCHYNLLPVHNELQRPSDDRVHWWLRSTVWTATLFYLIIGMAGSAYGHCTSTGKVQGNVLLDFAADDPLLMVGRMCLALTLTMAFPMLTIPGRDILIRSLAAMPRRGRRVGPLTDSSATVMTSTTQATLEVSNTAFLQEPLLENDHLAMDEEDQQGAPHGAAADNEPSTAARLLAAILVLWSAAAVASFCKSIDVVWDLLGSSLSCLLSFLIPCGAYLMIAAEHDQGSRLSKVVAGLLLAIFTPLMIVSTTNAVINTFFA